MIPVHVTLPSFIKALKSLHLLYYTRLKTPTCFEKPIMRTGGSFFKNPLVFKIRLPPKEKKLLTDVLKNHYSIHI